MATNFPLRWESTGDQWWYASPIDWAAANGHYEVVRELLRLDANLLIKLTSLRRLRRLESLWDDDLRFSHSATCRSSVARRLLLECDQTPKSQRNNNALIRAGYGGWLLYAAAAAGDASFVAEILDRDPLLVFGEGEYGVTDVFYAAARGRNGEVFRMILERAVRPVGKAGGEVFRGEMVSRAVHAAARGGDLGMMKEIVEVENVDIFECRDVKGCTLLHAAAGKGQDEVVKYLVETYDIINSKDNQGNTALHIAAYRGHLQVVETLVSASPSIPTERNNTGDTFLHMAIAGFRTPGFRRLDRQMDLIKKIVSGTIINIQELINLRNNDGRTALHVAVIGNMNTDLVELLMAVPSIDFNSHDIEGMTPVDLLKQRPQSVSSEILIKQLASAGGLSNFEDHATKSIIANQLKLHGIGSSPGTSFKISDTEIFLYAGVGADTVDHSARQSSCSSSNDDEITPEKKNHSSVNRAARRLKVLLGWSARKEKKGETEPCEREDTPTPLRQRFPSSTALMNNKRTLAVRTSTPSPAMKKKYAAGLMHGVMQEMPHLAPTAHSPSDSPAMSGMSTPTEKLKGICDDEPSCSYSPVKESESKSVDKFSKKSGFAKTKLKSQYFCFGAQGLVVEDALTGRRSRSMFKRSALSAA